MKNNYHLGVLFLKLSMKNPSEIMCNFCRSDFVTPKLQNFRNRYRHVFVHQSFQQLSAREASILSSRSSAKSILQNTPNWIFFKQKVWSSKHKASCLFSKGFCSHSKCLHLSLYFFVAKSTFETDKGSVIYLYEYIMQYMT